MARATIKEHATKKYGHVCSVGNWITYKPKSAMQDVARALGGDLKEVIQLTTKLPTEFDDLTLEDHKRLLIDAQDEKDEEKRRQAKIDLDKFKLFYEFQDKNPRIVDVAFKLVGKIRAQGTHAGGIIIADRPIDDLIPLSFIGGDWVSQWTEGKATQLSKFGLVKFDVLGLKTMFYIWQCCNFVKQTKGIVIDLTTVDPTKDCAGVEIHPDGTSKNISLNDREAIKICNDLRTESVFQIETSIQKGIIHSGGVRNFWDLVVYNALGRPGPMDMIPEYIKRRDDKSLAWKKGVDDRITNLLSETYNVIVYQEQLQAMWIRLAGFTVPEAEAHRKVISKKWKDKLPLVEKQWKTGAAKTIGQDEADKWWGLMVEFGRYAFNRAHSVAYSLITYWCLYLKAHYPAEWWAAAMAGCHKDKLKSYMGAAKLEGVVFGGLDVNKLTYAFAVIDDKVVIGLQAVKGVGEKASGELCSLKGPFTNVDEMVGQLGKKKGIFERLIKLGAFDKLHPNRKGLWMWYQYKYCSGPEFTELRKEIDSKIMPPESDLEKIRAEKIEEFSRLYPKRKKIPKTLLEWKPKIGHRSPVPSRDQVIDLYDDYTLKEKLGIEKDILGYYWTSPRGMFRIQSGTTLEDAKVKKTNCRIEVVIEDVVRKISKNKNPFYILSVTDGIQEADITIWESTVNSHKNLFHPGQGIIMNVDYSPDRNNFKISKDNSVRILQKTDVPIDTTNQDMFQKYEEKEDDFPYI